MKYFALLLSLAALFSITLQRPKADFSCTIAVEMMLLQDYSSSFVDDLPILETELVELFEYMLSTFPETKFGIATFTDKPVAPFGFEPMVGFQGDWCLNVTHKIGDHDPATIVAEMLSSPLGSGRDWPENQLGAMHDIVKNHGLSGFTEGIFNENGLPVLRLLVLSTDAIYHIAGDGALPPNNMYANDGDELTVCDEEDYPTIDQLRDALQDNKVYTIVLAGNHTGEDLVSVYGELMDVLGTPGSVHELQDDSSNIVETMIEALEGIVQLVCDTPVVDFVLSQDVTYSYHNDQSNLAGRYGDFMDEMSFTVVAPRYGLTSFADKPLRPLGSPVPYQPDYCYRLEEDLTDDYVLIENSSSSLVTYSGIDWKESQLDAIISSVVDTMISWRTGDSWNGFDLYRIIAVATDSGYHKAPDAFNEGYDLDDHSGGLVKCITEEYPSVEKVANALLSMDVAPLFVPTSEMYNYYVDLLVQLEAFGVVGDVVRLNDFGDDVVFATKMGVKRLSEKIRISRGETKRSMAGGMEVLMNEKPGGDNADDARQHEVFEMLKKLQKGDPANAQQILSRMHEEGSFKILYEDS